MKRKGFALGTGLLVALGLTGCARGGNDYFDRAEEHFDTHVLKLDDQRSHLHWTIDKWLFDLEEDDYELYE